MKNVTKAPKERPFGVLGVVRLGLFDADRAQFGGHETQILPLQAADDLADQSAFHTIRLHNDKGSIHERRRVAAAHTGWRAPPVRQQGQALAQTLNLK